MKPEFILTSHQISTLDELLKAYYDNREDVGELIFEPLLYRLTKSYDSAELYKNTLTHDGHLELTLSEYDRSPCHHGHITQSGISFYESGGYLAQSKAQRQLQEQEQAFRLREINAAEDSAKAAIRSANSADQSAKSARKANRLSFSSVLVAMSAFVLSIFQYIDNRGQNEEISSLRDSKRVLTSKVRQLNSQLIEDKMNLIRLKSRFDSLSKRANTGLKSNYPSK
ncbi:hypothetical protein ACO2Q8_04040 [Larkinella sp. VNQ87]|uniref:hypothetical protein n=1 Tax=Larkinella sp. VNQ87 TaxID=3400921 RepID=UPI003C0484B1